MNRMLLMATLLLTSSASVAATDGADAYCSYVDRLLDQGVIGDAELLQVAESAEKGLVVDPITPERARAEHQASVAKRVLQTLSHKAASSAKAVLAWTSAKLKARGVAQQEREDVSVETKRLPSATHSYRRIALGAGFACALSANDELACWGKKIPYDLAELALLGPLLSVQAVDEQLCVLSKKGEFSCTKSNAMFSINPRPGLGPVRSFATGNGVYCVLLENSSVECFRSYSPAFKVPAGLGEVKYLVGNLRSIYAVRQDDTVVLLNKESLVYPFGVEPIRYLAAQSHEACAILSSGRIVCAEPVKGLPAEVVDGTLMLSQYVACVMSPEGLLSCNYQFDESLQVPKDVGPVQDAFLMHRGGCALTWDHRVQCWGNLNESSRSLELPPSPDLEEVLRLQTQAAQAAIEVDFDETQSFNQWLGRGQS